MRAVVCHELTGPKGLRIDDVAEPEVGAGDVLIEARAIGVNFPDLLVIQGKYQFQPSVPFVPGGEVSGVVAAVGAGVSSVKPGDRVVALMLSNGFAERAVVPAPAVIKLPDAVSFEDAAACLWTYGTSHYALIERAQLRHGETLLVLGAAGGVGLSAVDLGKHLGARVIAAASSDEKLELCKERGADAVINYSREDLKARAKELSNGGVDVVYDPVGGALAQGAVRSMAWGGRFLVIGFASGDIPEVPLNVVLLKSCQIVGVFWGAFAMREPERNAKNIQEVLEWIGQGKIAPSIDATLPLERAAEALERLEARKVRGKLVLLP